MTERKRESPAPSERLDNLIGDPAQKEAKKQVLVKWSNALNEKPSTNKLRIFCCELLDSPHLIEEGRYAPYIYLILKSWLAKTRVPKRGNSGKEIADLVAYFHKPGVQLAAARKSVAELLGMTEAAVTQNDLRHRKAKRDKPR
jgi:hypothetical protein